MNVHTVFAIVLYGEVKQVVVGDFPNVSQVANEVYGNEAHAINVTQIPVQEGDKYIDGQFRHYYNDVEFEIIEPIPSESEKIEALKRMSDQKDLEITQLQLALVSIYEKMEA